MASSSDINASAPIENYPYPTEFNVLDFVPKLLSGRNYHKWQRLMRDFIQRRGLIGLIDATAEEESANQDYDKARNRSDNLVQAWILATLTEDIRLLLTEFKTAKDLWTALELIFIPESWATALTDPSLTPSPYLPLHKAVIKGDLDEAMRIIQEDPDAVRACITGHSETALMVAVKSAGRNDFASKLLAKMTPEDVQLVDGNGDNALHWAAYCDNIEGAKMLVNKNPKLPNDLDGDGDAPLHCAAVCGFKDMVLYLMKVTSEDVILTDKVGVQLLCALTSGELYDIALTLLERKPELARSKRTPTPLDIIGEKRSSFRSGYSLNFWQILIYSGVPIKTESIANNHNGGGRGDIESPANCCISVRQRSHFMFWKVAEKLVPHIRCIREKKLRHHHALVLVNVLCNEVTKLNPVEVRRIFSSVLPKATRMGIHEIVEEIILSFPTANFFPNDQNGRYTLQDAILWRCERVFNLIYQMDRSVQPQFISKQDKSLNNGLHLAAFLGPEQQINLRASAAGAVLQMQRELQWFKEVEKFTAPGDKEKRNANGMTPAELFSDTHQNLVKDGEQWMKGTATSCTIVAALIATMVFTAAITVPGGNNNNGHPILSKQKVFVIFGISDALALFSSITSALMFLLILTSRYAEEDFLHTLPKRLIIGLVTLFVSILFTMVAFGAILYLVFGDNKAWIFIPVTALASIPITLFGALQFPLLVEMFQSTYGRGIFGKQNDRVLQ